MLVSDKRDLKLDASGNLVVGTDLQWTSGIAGVIQSCRIKLEMFKGEWFLDRTKGISWWEEILGQKPDVAIAAITSEFYEALMGVEDVIEVTKLDIAYDGRTRTIAVSWAVQCQFGNTPVIEQSIPI